MRCMASLRSGLRHAETQLRLRAASGSAWSGMRRSCGAPAGATPRLPALTSSAPQARALSRFIAAAASKSEADTKAAQALSQMGVGDDEAAAFLGEENSTPLVSVQLFLPGDDAANFVDVILGEGAVSCSVDDANKGTALEQEMFQAGSLAGEKAFYYREPGSPEYRWTDDAVWKECRVDVMFPEDVDISAAVGSAAAILGLPMPVFQVQGMVDTDWVQKVKDSFVCTEVADGIWVVPSWLPPTEPGDVNILLEPGLAFGTGEHPTTRLCTQWMKTNIAGGERVMDYGHGSGILAIGALLLGAGAADGVDIDPLAVDSGITNAALNGVSERSDFGVCSNDGVVPDAAMATRLAEGGYDVVIANILMPPLLLLVQTLSGAVRPGGKICLSGILAEDQAPRVVEAYSEYFNNLTIDIDPNGQWACVHGTRRTAA